jgi:ribosomal protein S27E
MSGGPSLIGRPEAIIGQPTVGEWFVATNVTCPSPCGRTHLLHGKPGAGVGCLGCGNTYQLTGLPVVDPTTGQVQIPLALGRLPGRTT